jgi:peptide chain release factor 1
MDKNIIDKLEKFLKESQEAEKALLLPENINDIKKITSLNKVIKNNFKKIELYNNWKNIKKDIEDANTLLKNEKNSNMIHELKNMILEGEINIKKIEEEILDLLTLKDENDNRNVIIEIQGAAGGDESKIFAGDLFRLYQRYSAKMNWTIEVIHQSDSETGGFSNISFYVRGDNVYHYLKFEAGVHRVQRIPTTETKGRVHTSTVTVSVLPEVDQFEVEINNSDLRIDTYRSGGKGGQHANKTDSAVRVTHIPTGIVAQSQDGRSQHHNKEIALDLIRSRIFEIKLKEKNDSLASDKKSLIGTGDRSEKIRTYNYPQNRITDHRIDLTLKKLDRVMEGDLAEIIDALIKHNNL